MLRSLTQDAQWLLMTEKDAVKCRAFAKDNWWYLPVDAQLRGRKASWQHYSGRSDATLYSCARRPVALTIQRDDVMTSTQSLSLQTARNLHLSAQGLLRPPRRQARSADILSCVQRMSLLQIDTINIVARSPYLVLFSRLGAFPAEWLEQTLAAGELMEYWAHEACFLPREDFALLRHRMLAPDKDWAGNTISNGWMQDHAAEIEPICCNHIDANWAGALRRFRTHIRDKAHKPGWWEWKPHKRHLEGLFTAGKVMVVERRNFQRVYDLTQRVMPHWDDERHALSENEAVMQMLENSARSLGIFRAQWLADYYRLNVRLHHTLLLEQCNASSRSDSARQG